MHISSTRVNLHAPALRLDSHRATHGLHAGMDSLLEAQVNADSHSSAVPDSKLLLAHAELAKPSRGPLNIICASKRAAKVFLLAFGDFLLAELQAQDPTTGRPLACSVLHVCSGPFIWHSPLTSDAFYLHSG